MIHNEKYTIRYYEDKKGERSFWIIEKSNIDSFTNNRLILSFVYNPFNNKLQYYRVRIKDDILNQIFSDTFCKFDFILTEISFNIEHIISY